jgi:FlaA1/EpsC-like NDP-sugar epimerase
LYSIEQEITGLIQDLEISEVLILPILASVRSERAMRGLLDQYRPHIIFHAAAYKHLPLVERNPVEGILNNVYGTKNIANLASEFAVPYFVLVSTDKAVRPTNIMGASKRLAEMVLQAMASDPKKSKNTIFSMVRFGNVLNSSGSVVPLFRKQIREGGPITLTHPEVTRFFMMIPEAAQLVVQASALAKGGDVFVLDMGEPVKILDLAKKMIQLSGLKLQNVNNPDGDIAIEITGLRPAEKLYEELLIGNDPKPTSHIKILRAHEQFLPLIDLEGHLIKFEENLSQLSLGQIKDFLKTLVHGYQPD